MLLFSAVLRAGDDYLLLQRQFQEVLSEWNRYTNPETRSLLRDSRDPKARKLLKFRRGTIENFVETSRKIQEKLKGVPAADDLSLFRHAENFRAVLHLCEGYVENEMSAGGSNHEELFSHALLLVQRDLAYLREIGFSCRNGKPAVSPMARAWPELYRYKRQLQIVKLCIKEKTKSRKVRMTPQEKELLRECSSISQAAEELGNRVARSFPELSDSGVLLSVMTRKLLEESGIITAKGKIKTTSSLVSEDKQLKPSERIQQINSLLRTIESRIHAAMQEEERSKMDEPEPPADSGAGTARRPSEPVHPTKTPSPSTQQRERTVPLERRSDEELNGELLRLRQQILPDASRRSLTADELKQCLDLLSEREQKQYETIRARLIRNGSDQYEATLGALKELKEILTAPDAVFPSKQEKVLILKRAAGAGK